MENHENLVDELEEQQQETENVDTATEEAEQQEPETLTFSKKEFEDVVGKKKALAAKKERRKFEKENEKLLNLVNVLKAATGTEDVDQIIASLSGHLTNQGQPVGATSSYSERDIKILAAADADEIIQSGMEEVEEELKRLASVGKDGMSAKDKAMYQILAQHYATNRRNSELEKLGVTPDVYNSKEFQQFVGMFGNQTPIRQIYDIYQKMQPKKEHQSVGSVKNTGQKDDGIKEFYTPEEAKKFTKKDFDNNPKLWQSVLASMSRWKK